MFWYVKMDHIAAL